MIIKDNMANMCAKVTSTYMEFTLAFGPKPEFSFSFKLNHILPPVCLYLCYKSERMFCQYIIILFCFYILSPNISIPFSLHLQDLPLAAPHERMAIKKSLSGTSHSREGDFKLFFFLFLA